MVFSSASRVRRARSDTVPSCLCRCIDVFSLQRGEHETENFISEALGTSLLTVSHTRSLEERFDVADGVGSHLQLLHQAPNDVVLECAGQRDAVDKDTGVVRSKALDASDTLFDNHRIPRQVVIDQHVSGLEVDTFGARFRGDDDVELGGGALKAAMVAWFLPVVSPLIMPTGTPEDSK